VDGGQHRVGWLHAHIGIVPTPGTSRLPLYCCDGGVAATIVGITYLVVIGAGVTYVVVVPVGGDTAVVTVGGGAT
jgi:hypothetical protein